MKPPSDRLWPLFGWQRRSFALLAVAAVVAVALLGAAALALARAGDLA